MLYEPYDTYIAQIKSDGSRSKFLKLNLLSLKNMCFWDWYEDIKKKGRLSRQKTEDIKQKYASSKQQIMLLETFISKGGVVENL